MTQSPVLNTLNHVGKLCGVENSFNAQLVAFRLSKAKLITTSYHKRKCHYIQGEQLLLETKYLRKSAKGNKLLTNCHLDFRVGSAMVMRSLWIIWTVPSQYTSDESQFPIIAISRASLVFSQISPTETAIIVIPAAYMKRSLDENFTVSIKTSKIA